jgi:hypothetical protein
VSRESLRNGQSRGCQTLHSDCSPRTPSGERSGGLGARRRHRAHEVKAECVQSIFVFSPWAKAARWRVVYSHEMRATRQPVPGLRRFCRRQPEPIEAEKVGRGCPAHHFRARPRGARPARGVGRGGLKDIYVLIARIFSCTVSTVLGRCRGSAFLANERWPSRCRCSK